MSVLPNRLTEVLENERYAREDPTLVGNALKRLGVDSSDTFKAFYHHYEGPFWEEHVPFELLDLVDGENNIESYTLISRQEHGFLNHFLILSEMTSHAVLVLNTVTDKVYIVDFEGADERLKTGELEETWSSFFDFLQDYFNC